MGSCRGWEFLSPRMPAVIALTFSANTILSYKNVGWSLFRNSSKIRSHVWRGCCEVLHIDGDTAFFKGIPPLLESSAPGAVVLQSAAGPHWCASRWLRWHRRDQVEHVVPKRNLNRVEIRCKTKLPPWHRVPASWCHSKQQFMEGLKPGCILTQHRISPLLSKTLWHVTPSINPTSISQIFCSLYLLFSILQSQRATFVTHE